MRFFTPLLMTRPVPSSVTAQPVLVARSNARRRTGLPEAPCGLAGLWVVLEGAGELLGLLRASEALMPGPPLAVAVDAATPTAPAQLFAGQRSAPTAGRTHPNPRAPPAVSESPLRLAGHHPNSQAAQAWTTAGNGCCTCPKRGLSGRNPLTCRPSTALACERTQHHKRPCSQPWSCTPARTPRKRAPSAAPSLAFAQAFGSTHHRM